MFDSFSPPQQAGRRPILSSWFSRVPVSILLLLLLSACQGTTLVRQIPTSRVLHPPTTVAVWLTTPDLAAHLTQEGWLHFQAGSGMAMPTITIDASQRYQTMVGIGASLTQTASALIAQSPEREYLMQQLFDPARGIGLSFLRQPLGSSDFSDIGFYSYEDHPGQFSLGHDLLYSIPLLQEARRLNPALSLMGTPWSPPGWMKDSGSLIAGTLRPDAYEAYAAYLVQTLQAWQAEGLPLSSLSVQNEPGYLEGYPGAQWNGTAEARFIGQYLQPALRQAGLAPTLLGYDSLGADEASFLALLAPLGVSSALHCYGGMPTFWTGSLFETECASSLSGRYASLPLVPLAPARVLFDWLSLGSRTITFWNIAADPWLGPQPRGSAICHCLPLLTIQPDGTVDYRPDFYVLGQASKFVRPGAIRIGATSAGSGVEALAFLNPDGSVATLLYNPTSQTSTVQLVWQEQGVGYTLPAGAMATLTWPGSTTLSQPS